MPGPGTGLRPGGWETLAYTTSPCFKHSGKVSVKIQRSLLYHYIYVWNFSIVQYSSTIRIPLVGALSYYCCWAQRLPPPLPPRHRPAPAYSMDSIVQLWQSVNRCFRYKSSFPIRRRRSVNNKIMSWHPPCPYFRHVIVVTCTVRNCEPRFTPSCKTFVTKSAKISHMAENKPSTQRTNSVGFCSVCPGWILIHKQPPTTPPLEYAIAILTQPTQRRCHFIRRNIFTFYDSV